MMMLDESEALDSKDIEGDQVVNIVEIWKLNLIESQEKRKRLADVIIHAIQQGFLVH